MNNFKYILILILIVAPELFAMNNTGGGGSTVGNGGDFVSSKFILEAYHIADIVKANPEINLPADFSEIQEKLVKKMIMVVTIEEQLFDKFGRPVDALNFPGGKLNKQPPILDLKENEQTTPLIILSKEVWMDYFRNNNFLVPLVAHEFLGVLGVDDDNFVYSKKLLRYGPCKEVNGKMVCANYFPLIEAVKVGDVDRAAFLVKNGIALDTADDSGKRAGNYAWENHDIEMIKLLHTYGATTITSDGQKTFLRRAVWTMNNFNEDPNTNPDRYAPFEIEEYNFSKELVSVLMDIETVDYFKETLTDALMEATSFQTLDYIIPLVDRGAEITTPSPWGVSHQYNKSLIHSLMRKIWSLPPFTNAGDLYIAKVITIFRYVLEKNNFDFEASTDPHNERVLDMINPLYDYELAKVFFEFGANPNFQRNSYSFYGNIAYPFGNGSTLLMLSALMGATNFVNLLVDHSVDLAFLDKDGNDPLYFAIYGTWQFKERVDSSAVDTISTLISAYKFRGISINRLNNFGKSVLDLAEGMFKTYSKKPGEEEYYTRMKEIIKLLLDNGACRTTGLFNRCRK